MTLCILNSRTFFLKMKGFSTKWRRMNLAGSAKMVPKHTSRLHQTSSSLSQTTCTLVTRVGNRMGTSLDIPHTLATMGKGIYPQMSIPDIINALAGWGISVSPDQLKLPNSEFVEGVYCACLHQVTDLSHDSLQDPVKNALATSQAEDKVF